MKIIEKVLKEFSTSVILEGKGECKCYRMSKLEKDENNIIIIGYGNGCVVDECKS